MSDRLSSLMTLLACLTAFSVTASAQVVTVTTEFFEDFNGNSNGTPDTNCPNPAMERLVNGWTNLQGELPSSNEWTPNSGGTPSSGTGPAVDADGSSSGIYLFTETSGGCIGGDVAIAESPTFQASAMIDPVFTCSYHMFGAAQGELHFDVVNVTQGTTTPDVIPPFMGDMGNVWRETQRVRIRPFLAATSDEFRIAIRAVSGTSFTSDTAIDNFRIFENISIDVGVLSVDVPAGSVRAGVPVTLSITVENFGAQPVSSIPVEYSLNGGPFVTEVVPGTLAPGATLSFSFVTQASFVAGVTSLRVRTALAGDGLAQNDAIDVDVSSFATIGAFPYSEDFEGGAGGFIALGRNSSWEFGTPSDSAISAAASGLSAWVTDLNGDYNASESSTLTSPFFDCSGLVQPVLSFSLQHEIRGLDSAFMEISFDGETFTRLGTIGRGANWYVQPNIWIFGSDGIRTAVHFLDGAAGQPLVQVRWVMESSPSSQDEGIMVDDVRITEFVPGLGQAPQPTASLDVDEATEANGFMVGDDRLAGPYFAEVALGDEYFLTLGGEPRQPVVLFAGSLAVGAIPAPPAGLVDVDPVSIVVVADGTTVSLFDSIFVLDGAGERSVRFVATPAFSGAVFTLQAAVFNSLTGLAFSNAVEVTFQ